MKYRKNFRFDLVYEIVGHRRVVNLEQATSTLRLKTDRTANQTKSSSKS